MELKQNIPELSNFIESKEQEILAIAQQNTKETVEKEMALFEFNLFVSSLGKEHLEKAHNDTESFKQEMWIKAKEISKKSGKETLEEYNDLINFI